MKTRNLKDISKSFLLFLGFLYALIPFEASSAILTNAIHIVALMFVMGYALFLSNFKLRINKIGRITLMIIAFFVLISSMVSYDRSGLIFTFSIIFGAIIASLINYNSKFNNLFLVALKWLIIFSISMLFLQIVILNISGNVIRIHEMIYPFSMARISINEGYNDLYRMGGIYIEPGTYSNMMYLFLIIYIVISKKISSSLLIIGAISIIFSYSVWGMVFGSFLFIILMVAKLKGASWKKKMIVLFALVLVGIISVNYLTERPEVIYAIDKVNSDANTVVDKEMVYRKYKETFDSFLLIGEGFTPQFNIGLISVQDSGFLLNLSIIFGIFFALIILVIYSISFLRCFTWIIYLASLPIFISKIFYFEPVFWLLFFLLIYKGFSFQKSFGVKNIYNSFTLNRGI